jgi:hypothetical protein
MILRNFPPQKQLVLQREHPLILRADELDPSRLKKPKKANQSVYSSTDLLEVLEQSGGPLAYNEWRDKCIARIGFARTTFYKYYKELRAADRVYFSEIDEKWSKKSSTEECGEP